MGFGGSRLNEISFLTWKSKETQKREAEEYEKWAFPYGAKQREALTKLLYEVFPKKDITITLVSFLTCKELFEDFCKTPDMAESTARSMVCGIKKYKMLLRKKEMPYFVALALADATVNEECLYPSAEDILLKASQFEKLREDAQRRKE